MPYYKTITLLIIFLIGTIIPINSYSSNPINIPTDKSFKLEMNEVFLILNQWSHKSNSRETAHANVKLNWNICDTDLFIKKNIVFHEGIVKERINLTITEILRAYAAKNKDLSKIQNINKELKTALNTLGICAENIRIEKTYNKAIKKDV